MRDASFTLTPGLFAATAPFTAAQPLAAPWLWRVRDALGSVVAVARTRAGARAATLALHARRKAA